MMWPWWAEATRLTAPADADFLSGVEQASPFSIFPPLALLTLRSTSDESYGTFMRLHLVIVATHRHWSRRHKGIRFVSQFLHCAFPRCTPMSASESVQGVQYHNDPIGYAQEPFHGSCSTLFGVTTNPSYLLTPSRVILFPWIRPLR